MRTRPRLAACLVVLAALSAGCGGPAYVHFRPAHSPEAADTGWVAEGVYGLPPGEEPVTVAVAARGQQKEGERGVAYQVLHIRFDVQNRGDAAFGIDPDAARLIDDEGRTHTGLDVLAGNRPRDRLNVAAGAESRFTFVFDLPPDMRFSSLGSLRLRWPWTYGEAAGEATTKFIKIESVDIYRPDPWYDPWYHPWYGPRYYGPHSRWNFGMSYGVGF